MRLTSKRAVTVGEIGKAEGMTSTVDITRRKAGRNSPRFPAIESSIHSPAPIHETPKASRILRGECYPQLAAFVNRAWSQSRRSAGQAHDTV